MTMRADWWLEFFDATREREPRDMVLKALEHVPSDGRALDLGCGCGGDTLAMLAHGLHVIAIDGQSEAITHTNQRVARAGLGARFESRVQTFENLAFEQYVLINAGFSLPFCAAGEFESFWARLRHSLRGGGVFAGQLFGDRDEWAGKADHVAQVFLNQSQVKELIAGMEAIHFEEVETDGQTAIGEPKHWHVFHMVLREP